MIKIKHNGKLLTESGVEKYWLSDKNTVKIKVKLKNGYEISKSFNNKKKGLEFFDYLIKQ
jgi:hypothetical protein